MQTLWVNHMPCVEVMRSSRKWRSWATIEVARTRTCSLAVSRKQYLFRGNTNILTIIAGPELYPGFEGLVCVKS